MNNGGGGIFRILPGHKETETFNTYFETSHQLNANHLCKMYGFDYLTATNEIELEESFEKLFSNNESPSLLEIFTPEKINDKVLKEYFNKLL